MDVLAILDELDGLDAKALPPPWYAVPYAGFYSLQRGTQYGDGCVLDEKHCALEDKPQADNGAYFQANAFLLSALRNRYPSLSSQVRALIEERDALREALKAVHDWRGLCDAGDLETFERIAELFRRDSGMLAPGKDQAAALGGYPTDEERRTAWNAWRTRKNDELNAQIRAALSRSKEDKTSE